MIQGNAARKGRPPKKVGAGKKHRHRKKQLDKRRGTPTERLSKTDFKALQKRLRDKATMTALVKSMKDRTAKDLGIISNPRLRARFEEKLGALTRLGHGKESVAQNHLQAFMASFSHESEWLVGQYRGFQEKTGKYALDDFEKWLKGKI